MGQTEHTTTQEIISKFLKVKDNSPAWLLPYFANVEKALAYPELLKAKKSDDLGQELNNIRAMAFASMDLITVVTVAIKEIGVDVDTVRVGAKALLDALQFYTTTDSLRIALAAESLNVVNIKTAKHEASLQGLRDLLQRSGNVSINTHIVADSAEAAAKAEQILSGATTQ